MKTFICVLFAIIFMLGSTMILDADLTHAKAKYQITLGHVEPIHSSTHEAALAFKKMVEEESKGEVEV